MSWRARHIGMRGYHDIVEMSRGWNNLDGDELISCVLEKSLDKKFR